MDIQAYIQSGLIESYVLSLTSVEEIAEVDRLRKQYVEIDEAIDEFSLELERTAFENSIAPPPELKQKILSALKEDNGSSTAPTYSDESKKQAPVVSLTKTRNWRMIAAASIILFIVSAALNYYLYNQYSDNKEAYQALLSQRETLQASNQIYQTQLKEWQLAAVMMADTGMATVKMHSIKKDKDDAATVFWDKKSKDVYLMVNKLPEPVTGRQYQLWAMVDGKPVDAGLLDPSCTSVCKMKNIPKAQAFAITLEKEGGNPAPTLKALYVMGSI